MAEVSIVIIVTCYGLHNLGIKS